MDAICGLSLLCVSFLAPRGSSRCAPIFTSRQRSKFTDSTLICNVLPRRNYFLIAHVTVTGGKEAGVDLVLIQPFLHNYVNHAILMQTVFS